MLTVRKALGFWRYSRQLRKRFGLIAGLRLANAMADVTHRRLHEPILPVRIPGWSDPLWLRPGTSDVDVFYQVHVGRDLELDIVPPPRRVVDGGANIGLATRVFADRWPNAEIVAVELESKNYDSLVINCGGIPQVNCRWAALWNNGEGVRVDAGAETAWMFRAFVGPTGSAVASISMEQLFDELGWDVVDLVKLDIEGAEVQVLSTADQWIHRVNHIAVELHDRFQPGCRDAFDAAINPADWLVRQHGEYLIASRRNPV